MILSRELGKRIWGGSTNIENGGGGVSSDAIAGLLTGYAKESWVDEHYISIDFFSRLFQAHGTENGSEIDVMPNDMETTITSVESMFGFWTNLYISALGSNGAAPAGISLGMLTDVNISGTPSAGQVLTFDAVTQKWVNGNAQAGATALANLTDVTLTSVYDGQIMIYNSNLQKWVNSSIKTINGYSILGDGNINISGGVSGNYMFINERGSLNVNNCYANAGLYMIAAGSNLPSGSQYGAVLLLPYRAGVGNSKPDFSGQIFMPNGDDSSNPNGMYYRTSTANSYNDWQEIISNRGGQTINNSLRVADLALEHVNEINSYSTSGAICLNWRSSGSIILCNGGGAVAIKQSAVTYSDSALEVNGITRTTNDIRINGYDKGIRIDSPQADEVFMFGASSAGYIYGTRNDMYLRFKDGYVGVKTLSPSYALHVTGTIYATGAITALSDARKKDITGEAGVTVEQIAHAPAVQFLWKDKERRKDGQQIGTLAQYWQTVLPEVVSDKGGELSMQYGVAALVSAIVTARKVVDHERRIHELEKENKQLKKEVEQLRLN